MTQDDGVKMKTHCFMCHNFSIIVKNIIMPKISVIRKCQKLWHQRVLSSQFKPHL